MPVLPRRRSKPAPPAPPPAAAGSSISPPAGSGLASAPARIFRSGNLSWSPTSASPHTTARAIVDRSTDDHAHPYRASDTTSIATAPATSRRRQRRRGRRATPPPSAVIVPCGAVVASFFPMPLTTFITPSPPARPWSDSAPGASASFGSSPSPVRSRRCHRGEPVRWRHRSPERDQHSTSGLNSAPAGRPEHQKPSASEESSTSGSEPDARRRPGRLPTDRACSRWMARRSRRVQTAPEGSSG